MSIRKSVVFGTILLAAVGLCIFSVFWGNHMKITSPSRILSEYIRKGNVDDLVLTIYFVDPSILTHIPVSIDGLINWCGDNKVTVSGSQLAEHIDLVNQMINTDLERVKSRDSTSYLNARVYYVFETNRGQKIFDVAMWGVARGDSECIVVNGQYVKTIEAFYSIIFPFLPGDYAKTLDEYISLVKH